MNGKLSYSCSVILISLCNVFFRFHLHRYVHGCLQSCSDADACNSAKRHGHHAADLESFMRHLLSLAVLSLAVAR